MSQRQTADFPTREGTHGRVSHRPPRAPSSGQQPPNDPIDVRLLGLVVVLVIGIAVTAVVYTNPALGMAITVGIAVMGLLLAILRFGGGSS